MSAFYEKPKSAELINNGDTVLLRLTYSDELPSISGGPLNGEFLFEQLYFHWMGNDTFDSEDRSNTTFFPAELHMVFRNGKYPTFAEATRESNGVAVLAYHYKEMKNDRFNYHGLIELLNDVVKPGAVAKFRRPLKLWDFIIYDIHDYYTYTGSLMTPPCSEKVIWIDFHEPILISEKQVEHFRKLYAYDMTPMIYSHRPLLPLSDRTVFSAVIYANPADEYSEYHTAAPFVDNLVDGAATWKLVEINILIGMFSSCFMTTWISTISQTMA